MKFDATIAGHRDVLGEAPHWDRENGLLYWVDIYPGLAHCLTPATGGLRTWRLGEPVSAVVPRAAGGLLVALASGLSCLDPVSGELEPLLALEPAALGNRANEARVDPTGRFWVATMQNDVGPDLDELPVTRSSGSLYRIDPGPRAIAVEHGIGIANTLCWDDARARLYFGDSLAGVIWAYDWDSGTGAVSNRRVFAGNNEHGVPDGSALDAEGCLWNARWGGGCLIRYRPDGTIDRIVTLPVRQPTSCVFAGPGLRTLYVTSASTGLGEAVRAPGSLDGAVLEAAAPVAGQACTASRL